MKKLPGIFLLLFSGLFACAQPVQTMNQWQQMLANDKFDGQLQCILFSKKQLIYLGTSNGLYEYDGTDVKLIAGNELKQQNITSLFQDVDETIWIGLNNGKILQYTQHKIIPFTPQEGLPKTAIVKLQFDWQKRLWFATQGEGIYVYDHKKLFNINTDDGLSDNYIYDIELLPNNIIAAASDRGLSLISFNGSKKTIENFTTANGLTDNIVRSISYDRADKNILWLGFQQGGICKFSVTAKKITLIDCPELQDEQVNDILVLDETIAVNTENASFQFLKNGKLANKDAVTKPAGFMLDAEANAWLISKAGLYKNNAEQLQLLVKPGEKEMADIHDLLLQNEQTIWYTAKSSVIKYDLQTGARKIIPLPGINSKTDITCLYQDATGNIWIGTMGNGMYLLNSNTNIIRPMNELPGNTDMSILSMSGRNKTVYISGLQGIYKAIAQNGQFIFEDLTKLSGIGVSYIYHIYEDSKGRVWFATDGKGLAMMHNGTFTHYTNKEGLTSKVVYSVVEDGKGNIWCTGFNNGLFKFNGKSFEHLGKAEGLPDLDISSLAVDNNGNLFCTGKSGIFLINPLNNSVILPATEKQTGILNTDLNSLYYNNSRIIFHSANGIFSFRNPSYKINQLPKTIISAVSLFLRDINAEQNKEFSHDENNLSFSFAGIYYTNPEKIQYQYQLEGYNNTWQYSKTKQVNFPKLQPGNYTFKVRSAVTGFFTGDNEASYSFSITKPFWKRWWFVILSIAAVTSFLAWLVKQREREAKKMQQLQTEKLQSQYETLKNQVNPHFLFNSFNTLLNIIDEDPKKASAYVEHLSDFYRSIVNMREKDLIPLGDELKIIEDYFFIQKKRFGNALLFENPVSNGEKKAYSIPPLTLQLLAENAIKHNIVSKDRPLTFSLEINNDQLIVKNNLNEKMNAEAGEGLGLQNIKNRFMLIANKEVKIEKTDTSFIIKLPLIKLS
jgi:ligand-binding sensor domain-containing protein